MHERETDMMHVTEMMRVTEMIRVMGVWVVTTTHFILYSIHCPLRRIRPPIRMAI